VICPHRPAPIGHVGRLLRQLWIPAPDHDLGVGSGRTPATAAVMHASSVIVELRPTSSLTYGEVNSTVAAALVAAKLRCARSCRAGLRTATDHAEEINRWSQTAVDCCSCRRETRGDLEARVSRRPHALRRQRDDRHAVLALRRRWRSTRRVSTCAGVPTSCDAAPPAMWMIPRSCGSCSRP